MKKVFFTPGEIAARINANLPQMTNRRMGLQAHRKGAVSYKSDGGDDDKEPEITKEWLAQELATTRKALEDAQTKKFAENLEPEIKKHFEAKYADKLKAIDEAIASIKGLPAEIKAEDLLKMKEELAVTIKAFDMLQIRLKNTGGGAPEAPKSFDEVLKKAMEDATDDITKFSRKETKSLVIDLKDVGDFSTANVTGGSRWAQVQRPGIIEQPRRKVHIRSLVPVGTIGAGTEFVFMRENGAGEGSIAPVAEGATKPQIDMDLIESSVKIETIAGWMRVTRKAMNNIPGFTSFLQARLPEKLLNVEDTQLLTGDGNTPNVKGIMTPGNYTAADTTATTFIERLIDSLAQLEDEEQRYATGILMRPREYYNFFKNKADGSGEYDLPQNVAFVNGVLYISGVPVYTSTAIANNKFIVGDWAMGAQLLIQEGMRLEFFEQDGTNVRENKITVRIEETIAFPVYGDNYFIVGDVAEGS
jgi:HK97 family phage major capsid protein